MAMGIMDRPELSADNPFGLTAEERYRTTRHDDIKEEAEKRKKDASKVKYKITVYAFAEEQVPDALNLAREYHCTKYRYNTIGETDMFIIETQEGPDKTEVAFMLDKIHSIKIRECKKV